jgi:LruC domain-containing protein
MKMFTKNAIMAAVGLSLAGIAGAYEVQNNTNKSIIWKYHNCVMDSTTGSTGDDGSAYYSQNQNNGRIPTEGPAAPCYATDFNTAENPLTAPATLDWFTSPIDPTSTNADLKKSRLALTLPESQRLHERIPLTGDDQTNIYVGKDKEVEVWVTFLTEGADWRNSVGFFTWSGNDGNSPKNYTPVRGADGLPKQADGTTPLNSERIIFPDASDALKVDGTPPLTTAGASGTTVYLGSFNGGDHGLGLGFFVASNAWSANGRGTGRNGTSPTTNKDRILYSVRDMNPECHLDAASCTGEWTHRNQHTIMLYDQAVTGSTGNTYRRLILGIEDQPRTGGDHDFNDVVLAIHVKEKSPGAFENITSIPGIVTDPLLDTDKDGVPDWRDEFPNDNSRAFSRYFPGQNSWGTLAYEDLWPSVGDYDFNDLLVRYRSREILNKDRQVVALKMDFRLDAAGAGYRNGFALSLPGISNDAIASATLQGFRYEVPGEPINLLTDPIDPNNPTGEKKISATPHLGRAALTASAKVVGGQNGSVFEIFKDATGLLLTDNGTFPGTGNYNRPTCQETGFRNTGKECGQAPAAEFKLTVNFASPIALSNFPAAPYDPFLFRAKDEDAKTKLGHAVEVHLPGRGPTSRADMTLFGKKDDRTPISLTQGTTNQSILSQSYLSNTKLPWVIHVPIEWNYPYEKFDFRLAYPQVVDWAATGGTTNITWFSNPALGADKKPFTFKAHTK